MSADDRPEFSAPAALEQYSDELQPIIDFMLAEGMQEYADALKFAQGMARDKAVSLTPPNPNTTEQNGE